MSGSEFFQSLDTRKRAKSRLDPYSFNKLSEATILHFPARRIRSYKPPKAAILQFFLTLGTSNFRHFRHFYPTLPGSRNTGSLRRRSLASIPGKSRSRNSSGKRSFPGNRRRGWVPVPGIKRAKGRLDPYFSVNCQPPTVNFPLPTAHKTFSLHISSKMLYCAFRFLFIRPPWARQKNFA